MANENANSNANISRVNQQVLQERVNSLRNQKEQIRQGLRNPGLYPDSVTPEVNLSNINEFYRPSQSLKNDLSTVFNYAYNNGGGDMSENSPNDYSGPAMSAETANAIGNLAGLIGGVTGTTPDGFGQTVGGALSGNAAQAGKGIANMAMSAANMSPYGRMGVNAAIDALSGKSATSVAKGLGLSALFSAVPQLAQVMALDKGITALSNLFGFDFSISRGLSEMISPTPTAKGYEGGFFGEPGLGLGIQGSIPGYGADSSGGTPAGYGDGDLGGGISGGIGSDTGATAGYGGGDLGGGISGGLGDSGLGNW